MNLTEQLGKTVLYGDVAISPDGKNVAWVQSTAATTSKQIYVRAAVGDSAAMSVKIDSSGERRDGDPAWSPDSKTLAFFSNAGEKNDEQKQLWIANADGSGAKNLTNLVGYAARPHWSHDGKKIAFLYIEGAGGGGPLLAAPTTTGVIDKAGAATNERIMRPAAYRWPEWIDRCRKQAAGALAVLAAEPWPSEAPLDQTQITTTCMIRYLQQADPHLLAGHHALAALSERLESRPEFVATFPADYSIPKAD